jgi:hypothetical protein
VNRGREKKKYIPRTTPKEAGEHKLWEKGTPQGKNKTCSDWLQRVLHGWAQWEKVKITHASLSETQEQKDTEQDQGFVFAGTCSVQKDLFDSGN